MAEAQNDAKLLETRAAKQTEQRAQPKLPKAATDDQAVTEAQKDAKLPETRDANTAEQQAQQKLPKAATADQAVVN